MDEQDNKFNCVEALSLLREQRAAINIVRDALNDIEAVTHEIERKLLRDILTGTKLKADE